MAVHLSSRWPTLSTQQAVDESSTGCWPNDKAFCNPPIYGLPVRCFAPALGPLQPDFLDPLPPRTCQPISPAVVPASSFLLLLMDHFLGPRYEWTPTAHICGPMARSCPCRGSRPQCDSRRARIGILARVLRTENTENRVRSVNCCQKGSSLADWPDDLPNACSCSTLHAHLLARHCKCHLSFVPARRGAILHRF